MITNINNLPAPIVAAIQNDDHISLGSDIGASTVGAPVQQVMLRQKHKGEIVEDAGERIWSLFGQAIHVILERAAKTQATNSFTTFAEERWEIDVLGWRVAARPDYLVLDSDGTLTDYKVTPVWWTRDDEPKPEWVVQVNLTRYIGFKAVGHNPKRLQVVGLLRDWRPGEQRKYAWYPKVQVATVAIPRWSDDECQRYLEDRVRQHQDARATGTAPPCTADERWERFDCRVGQKTWKSFPTQAEAIAFLKAQRQRSMRIVWEVPRCAQYCDVAAFCQQGQAINAALKTTTLK